VLIIKEKLAEFLVNGIRYSEKGESYKMEVFDSIPTYKDYIRWADKSIFEGIIWDSLIEKNFAEKINIIKNRNHLMVLIDIFLHCHEYD
jgi:hypothetical protein